MVSRKAVQVWRICLPSCTMYLHKASNVAAIQGSFFFLSLKYLVRKEITQEGVQQKRLIIAEHLQCNGKNCAGPVGYLYDWEEE